MLADKVAMVRSTMKNSHLDNLFMRLQRYGQRELLAPIEVQQVLPFAYPDDNVQYLLTLRLLTVH